MNNTQEKKMNDLLCKGCGINITDTDKERAEAIKDGLIQTTCKNCADDYEPDQHGFMDYTHKTAPSIVIVNKKDKDSFDKAKNVFRRKR